MMGAGIYGDPNFDFESHLVSTRASGTAITFKHPAAKYPCETNGIEGDVITAGGQVKISGSEEPDIGTIDTSGTHPLVSSCAGAIVDMVGLSDAIAAAPAVQTIDNLIVRRGEEATLDVTGGGIVRIERLSLEGVRGQVRYGYNNQCLASPLPTMQRS
jgi:hypothetical protein